MFEDYPKNRILKIRKEREKLAQKVKEIITTMEVFSQEGLSLYEKVPVSEIVEKPDMDISDKMEMWHLIHTSTVIDFLLCKDQEIKLMIQLKTPDDEEEEISLKGLSVLRLSWDTLKPGSIEEVRTWINTLSKSERTTYWLPQKIGGIRMLPLAVRIERAREEMLQEAW